MKRINISARRVVPEVNAQEVLIRAERTIATSEERARCVAHFDAWLKSGEKLAQLRVRLLFGEPA